jgi:hypothetical protein
MTPRALDALAAFVVSALLLLMTAALVNARRHDKAEVFHVERIDANGVACVAVKHGASVALSCNWPAAAPKWWQPQPEETKP